MPLVPPGVWPGIVLVISGSPLLRERRLGFSFQLNASVERQIKAFWLNLGRFKLDIRKKFFTHRVAEH